MRANGRLIAVRTPLNASVLVHACLLQALRRTDYRFPDADNISFLASPTHQQLQPFECTQEEVALLRPMNGVGPFLKSVGRTSKCSSSRIPHLRAHIHARRKESPSSSSGCPSNLRPCPPPTFFTPSRAFANSRSSKSFNDGTIQLQSDISSFQRTHDSSDFETSQHEVDKPETTADESSEQARDFENEHRHSVVRPLQSDPLRMTMEQVLDEGNTEKIMFALQDTSGGTKFIEEANDAEFSRAICALDSNYFVEAYIPLYRNLDPILHVNMTYRTCRSLEDRWEKYSTLLDDLIGKRIAAGHRLTLPVLQHLLVWAGSMGDYQLGKYIFEDMMPQQGVHPDLNSFNSYMKSAVWSSWHETRFRHRTRVIPHFADIRKEDFTFKLAPWKSAKGELFLPPQRPPLPPMETRQIALHLFQQLTGQGFKGNEETYTSLMLAMSQANDLEGVKSILKSVWNINIDLLQKYDEEEIESPTYYEADSPLRPTQLLLSTIVYIFGNHNDLNLAHMLLDYVSRNYNLPVSEAVWSRLYDTTYVLSCTHGWGPSARRKRQKKGLSFGQLDRKTLKRFFDLITDEPHNIQPTVVMLTRLAKIEWHRRILDHCLEHLRQAIQLLEEEKTKLSAHYDELLPVALMVSQGIQPLSTHFFELRRKFILDSMHLEMSLSHIIRLVRLTLVESNWPDAGTRPRFSQRVLPNLIKEFQTFLPNTPGFPTPTGYISILNGSVHRLYAVQCADDYFHSRIGNLRYLLDTEDLQTLMTNLRKLPATLEWRENFCFWCQSHDHPSRDCTTTSHRALAGLDEWESEPYKGSSEHNMTNAAPRVFGSASSGGDAHSLFDPHSALAGESSSFVSTSSHGDPSSLSNSDSVKPRKKRKKTTKDDGDDATSFLESRRANRNRTPPSTSNPSPSSGGGAGSLFE